MDERITVQEHRARPPNAENGTERRIRKPRASPANGRHRTWTSGNVSLSRACLFFVDAKCGAWLHEERREFPFSLARDDL
jgi:hypothetical protein